MICCIQQQHASAANKNVILHYIHTLVIRLPFHGVEPLLGSSMYDGVTLRRYGTVRFELTCAHPVESAPLQAATPTIKQQPTPTNTNAHRSRSRGHALRRVAQKGCGVTLTVRWGSFQPALEKQQQQQP